MALGLACHAVPAGAHGGTTIAIGDGAGYTVSVQALDGQSETGRDVLDLTVTPTRRSTGEVDPRADVRISINGAAPLSAVWRQGAYELYVVTKRPGEWNRWSIVATTSVEAGQIVVRRDPEVIGQRTASSSSGLLPFAGLAVLLMGVALAVRLRLGRTAA